MAAPLPPSAVRGLLPLLGSASRRQGRGGCGPGHRCRAAGRRGRGRAEAFLPWAWLVWGHCPYVRVTRPTRSARYVRIGRRGSDPNAWSVTPKAGHALEPRSLSGQVSLDHAAMPHLPGPGVPPVTRWTNIDPVRPKPARGRQQNRFCWPRPTTPSPATAPRTDPAPPLQLARERSEQQQQATDGGGRQRWRHVSHPQLPQTSTEGSRKTPVLDVAERNRRSNRSC